VVERCDQLLRRWRAELQLSGREESVLAPELVGLDRQLGALADRRLRVAVFGRVGVGKSSLLNALLGAPHFATDVAHGCTRLQQRVAWPVAVPGLGGVELVDTPGIDEIAARARQRLAARVAMGADLLLFVLDGDLSSPELEALEPMLQAGKPILLVLNRIDCWPEGERQALVASIRSRLPPEARQLELVTVASAPRRASLKADGRVRSQPAAPQVEPLRRQLLDLLREHGPLLLGLNGLRAADRFSQALHRWRLGQQRDAAQGLIGRFAALKATGVAINPLWPLDLAGGLALDTALVMQLCQLYGLPMGGAGARQLLGRLSTQNALLVAIQLLLGGMRSLLLLAAPLTAGLSLAPAAPVALAQAALAVHTTRLTGRLTATELLRSADRGQQRPGSLMRRLARQDPQVRAWLVQWRGLDGPATRDPSATALQALLP
jgi:small GTP-binding protein